MEGIVGSEPVESSAAVRRWKQEEVIGEPVEGFMDDVGLFISAKTCD